VRRSGIEVSLALAVGFAASFAACGQSGASFSPTGPCLVDGRSAGAYPELEAAVPRTIDGATATTVDSGRNCSDKALGTLSTHGVREIRFAGATFEQGASEFTVLVAFELPDGKPVDATWIEELYQSGALASGKTGNTTQTRPSMGDAGTVYRLDTLNDLSQQTVVVLPNSVPVRAAIVATRVDPGASLAAHNARVDAAVAALAAIVR